MENGVLGNALEGVQVEEEEEKAEDSTAEGADNIDGMYVSVNTHSWSLNEYWNVVAQGDLQGGSMAWCHFWEKSGGSVTII